LNFLGCKLVNEKHFTRVDIRPNGNGKQHQIIPSAISAIGTGSYLLNGPFSKDIFQRLEYLFQELSISDL
jgi:hypothetical protein